MYEVTVISYSLAVSHDGRETFGFLIAKDDEDLDEIAEALAGSSDGDWPDGFRKVRWRFGYGVNHAIGGLGGLDEIAPAKWISWDIESDGDEMRFLPAAEVEALRKKLKTLLASPGDATEAIHQALSLDDDETVEELLRAANEADGGELDPADAETAGSRMAHVLLLLRKVLRRAAARGTGLVAFYRQES